MKKLILTLSAAVVLLQTASAQTEINNNASESGWGYKISGFIDPQAFFDTREIVGGREEQMLFYPKTKRI